MLIFAISFFTALALCTTVYTARLFILKKINRDDLRARQRSHSVPTLRLGGIGVLAGVLASLPFIVGDLNYLGPVPLALFGGLAIFVIGLIEDLGGTVRPRTRLLAGFAIAVVLLLLAGLQLSPLGIEFLSFVTSIPGASTLLLSFAIVGLSHGFNLVDGLNGLLCAVALSANVALWYIGHSAGVSEFHVVQIAMTAALLAFMLFNFPVARLFMGDAGAYSVGFLLAWIAVYIFHEAPHTSPFALVLACFWPVADTMHAIVRRTVSGRSAAVADRLHMHHVMMRFLEIKHLGLGQRRLSNPLASVLLFPFVATPPALAALFWDDRSASLLCLVASCAGYFGLHALVLRIGKAKRRSRQEPALDGEANLLRP